MFRLDDLNLIFSFQWSHEQTPGSSCQHPAVPANVWWTENVDWMTNKASKQKTAQSLPKLEQLQSQLREWRVSKSLNQHSGSYEVIVAEGESLLLSVPPGEEKKTLQNQLVELKSHWEELSKKTADRQSGSRTVCRRLRNTSGLRGRPGAMDRRL